MIPSLTVIIPTLNESERLPGLLGALSRQTIPPQAVIVADAGSADDTAAIAAAHGAVVVPGGLPGPGRNAGAREATTDLLLFLDADVMPDDDFIEIMVREFRAQHLAVATSLMAALESVPGEALACEVANLYLQLVQHVSPHAPGFCILVERSIHERIGGFDESVVLAEDHDYVQRAAKLGRFGVISDVQLPVSMRRIRKEGLVRLAFKYVYCEMYALTGTPIHRVPFDYEFGVFDHPNGSVALMDIAGLRQRLGQIARAFSDLSVPGRDIFERLGAPDTDQNAFAGLLGELPTADLDRLQDYLRSRRRAVAELGERTRDSARYHSEMIKLRVRDEIEQLRHPLGK